MGPSDSLGSISHEFEVTSGETVNKVSGVVFCLFELLLGGRCFKTWQKTSKRTDKKFLNKHANPQARVFANKCEAPAASATFDGGLDFAHPQLSSHEDCLVVSIRLRPNRVSMWHSRDPAGSLVDKQFDSLFDIASRKSCCTTPSDVVCPSTIDHDYWIGFNQIIGVDQGGVDDKSTHRQTNRVKQVNMTFLTEADECKPCFGGPGCNIATANCEPPAITPVGDNNRGGERVQDGADGIVDGNGSTSPNSDSGNGGSSWWIWIVVVLVLLCLLLGLLALYTARRRAREDAPYDRHHGVYDNVSLESSSIGHSPDDFPSVAATDHDHHEAVSLASSDVGGGGGGALASSVGHGDHDDDGGSNINNSSSLRISADNGEDSDGAHGALMNAHASAAGKEDYELSRPNLLDGLAQDDADEIANYNFRDGGDLPSNDDNDEEKPKY